MQDDGGDAGGELCQDHFAGEETGVVTGIASESCSGLCGSFVQHVANALHEVGTVFRIKDLHSAALRAKATRDKTRTRFQRTLLSALQHARHDDAYVLSTRPGQSSYLLTKATERRGVEESFRTWVQSNARSERNTMQLLKVQKEAADNGDEEDEDDIVDEMLDLIEGPKDAAQCVLHEGVLILTQAMDKASGCNRVIMPGDVSYAQCVDSVGRTTVGFFHTLLIGRHAPQEEAESPHWQRLAVFLAQLVQGCRAGGRETPARLLLALVGRHEGTPAFVDLLHAFGICSSSRNARHLENFYATLTMDDGLLELRDIVRMCEEEEIEPSVSAVYDNLNFRTRGKLDGVGGADIGSLALIVTFSEGGLEKLEKRGTLNRMAEPGAKAPTAAPADNDMDAFPVYHKRRVNPPYDKENVRPVSRSALDAFERETQSWAVARVLREDVHMSFVDFARQGRSSGNMKQRERQVMITLTPICRTPESDEAISELFARLDEIMQLVGQNEIVLTVDVGMFYRVAQIVWGHPGLRRKIVVLPGGWHTAWTALKALGSWYQGTFVMQWLLDSGVFSTNTALSQAMLHPVHFHRAMRAHGLAHEVLLTAVWEDFLSSDAGSLHMEALLAHAKQTSDALHGGKSSVLCSPESSAVYVVSLFNHPPPPSWPDLVVNKSMHCGVIRATELISTREIFLVQGTGHPLQRSMRRESPLWQPPWLP